MNEGRLVATGTLDDLQGELDLGAPITLEVATVPETLALDELAGVRSVTVEDATITATCADPSVKVDVVRHVAEVTTVRDIVSEDVSLEQLFNTYTNGERDGGRDARGLSMSTVDVAKEDLDVRRAKIVWFVGAFYTLFMVLLVYFGQNGRSDPTILGALWNLTAIGAMFIPLIALVTAYLAIAGERESGGIKYLLSIPNSRRDVVLGKFATRTAIVSASIVVAFLVGGVLTLLWYPSPEMDTFGIMAALTVLYALTYVAVAIAISAATASRSRAMGGSIAFFFITSVLNVFGPLQLAIDYVLNDLAGLGFR